MLLLTGPAGSGKTFRILEQFRDALRRRDSGVRLLTPTATMAQHLQNQLAREGFVFRPGLIQTLSRFVDSFAADMPQVSEPLLYLIVEEAASRVDRPEFARVVRLPGFCAALARTIEEFSSAGCDAERLAQSMPRKGGSAPLGEAFLAVYRGGGLRTAPPRTGHALTADGTRRGTVRARRPSRGTHIWMDGFYALPDPDLAVVGAMCGHADLTLTLPAAAITEPTRERLLEMGFMEEACTWERTPPRIELCEAPSIEREADEIARRILEQAAAGRPFREMGVIVRSPELYRADAARDTRSLRHSRAVLLRRGLLNHRAGALSERESWMRCSADGTTAKTLAAIRLAPGFECDEFDFAVREKMPGNGLAALQALGERGPTEVLLDYSNRSRDWKNGWRFAIAPYEWAARLGSLRELFAPVQPEPGSYANAGDCAQPGCGAGPLR